MSAAAQRFSSPPLAFVTLQDYVPQKGGGLRPFFQGIAVGNSGIGTDEQCMGIYARNGAATRPGKTGGGSDSFDALCVTISESDFKVRIYRMDQSNDETTWTAIKTTAAVVTSSVGHQPTCFAFFQRKDGTVVYLLSIFVTDAAVSGLYSVGYAAGTHGSSPDNVVTRLQAYNGPLEVSQARILIGGSGANIQYSDVGDTSFTSPSTQVITVTPNRAESTVSIISGVEPSDLLVGKEGAPWVEINGDIANSTTPVREMGDDHHQRQNRQQVPRVPGGIAFIEGGGRIFITDGRTFTSISDQIQVSTLVQGGMVGPATMAFLDDYLFLQASYVRDFRTNAWFKQSAVASSSHWSDPYGGMLWLAGHAAGFDVQRIQLYNGTRVTTGVIQTVPYSDKNGRNIEVREVQLFVNTASTTEFKVELIDQTGSSVVTRYAVVAGAKANVVDFLFPSTKSEYLSVKVTATAVNGSSAAPDIERMRIGFGINNLVT